MKFIPTAFLLLNILLFSCRTSQTLPTFSYNGKVSNSLIAGRVPDYGDGHPYGCLIMWEFNLSLRENDDSVVVAKVENAESHEIVSGSVLQIFFENESSPINLVVDATGYAKFIKKRPIVYIKLSSVGYRTLNIYPNKKSKVLL